MIPTTMRPWWFDSLTDSNQEWSHSYARQITLTLLRPLFGNRTSSLTIFLDDVESCHPGCFVKALTNKKEFLPNVMCPFGCYEYCFKGKHVAWDLVIRRLLLTVLLPHIDKSRYLPVQHMWDQYDREDNDFDTILLNRPSIVISKTGCHQVVTCRNHGGGSKYQVLYPPCYPDHHLSAKYTDQLSSIVLQSRIARTTRANKFSTTFGMSRQFLHFSGIDSCDVGLNGNSSVTSELLCSHESIALAGRPDICALLSRTVANGQINLELSSSMTDESI